MTKNKKHKKIVERQIIKGGTIISVFLILASVFAQATLSKSNVEVERLKTKIKNQENLNQSLVMKINELSSLENIKGLVEEMGLAFNNNNIKSIK